MNFVTKQRYGWQVAVGAGLAILLGVTSGATAWAQAGGAGGSGAGGAGGASCADATYPNPIIITGSSAFEPTVKYFAAKAAALSTPYTIIYNKTGSCDGVSAIATHQALGGAKNTGLVYKSDGSASTPCKVDGLFADLAISDVFYESCSFGPRDATKVADIQGPVQAMVLIVPQSNSTINAVSAEQAAAIWGCGPASNVGMFTDVGVAGIQRRDMNSGTQILVGKNIGVPAGSILGYMNADGGALITSVANSTSPMQAIGFVAADTYKSAVNPPPGTAPKAIHALAFQGFGQTQAYYPDSTASSNDRRNVRDGHYVIAGPEHMIVPLNGSGQPSANAQKFIGWINGDTMIDANPSTWIDIEATAGTIPQCAMKVTHTVDGGFMAPYKPCKPCGCYYELKANSGVVSPSCVACSATAPCASGKTCSYGYCE